MLGNFYVIWKSGLTLNVHNQFCKKLECVNIGFKLENKLKN